MAFTKTEHAEYLKTARWQELRKEFLDQHVICERCEMPRWLAAIAYDQDFHAHHKSYAHKGTPEEMDDLEALCRRCHDIETFGRSDLREPKRARCEVCWGLHWDPRSNLCQICDALAGVSTSLHHWMTMRSPIGGQPLWQTILWDMHFALRTDTDLPATETILNELCGIDFRYLQMCANRNQPLSPISDEDIPF